MKIISEDDVFDKIKERILIMKDVDQTEVVLESTFESLGFDSLDYIEIQILALEIYNIRIPDEIFHQQAIGNIKNMVNYIITQTN